MFKTSSPHGDEGNEMNPASINPRDATASSYETMSELFEIQRSKGKCPMVESGDQTTIPKVFNAEGPLNASEEIEDQGKLRENLVLPPNHHNIKSLITKRDLQAQYYIHQSMSFENLPSWT